MSKTKFTEGEWFIASGKTYCAIRTEHKVVADMRTVNGVYSRHDAHLIAQAKNLYEMLDSLLMNEECDVFEVGEEIIELLAKCRGE